MRLPILLAFSSLLAPAPVMAQAAAKAHPSAQATEPVFVKSDAETAVTELASALNEFYTYPDPGKAYAAMLRAKLASGAYSNFKDAGAFAKAVTADLQVVHKDGHLRLQPMSSEMGSGAGDLRGFSDGSAVTKSGWIAPGIAYIGFEGFPGNEATLADVRAFLAKHKDATTLIIDERGNRGGGLAEMNLIFAQIFAEPTVLVTMDTRLAFEQGPGRDAPAPDSMRKVAGPVGVVRREHFVVPTDREGKLARAAVYVLVSNRTNSAGEHFAFALKRTHRARLIGEATAGANHFGGMVPMGTGYVGFVPVGRTLDPDTGKDWEGVGVQPDIAVPAEKALDEALKLAGVLESGDAALASLD